MNDVFKNLWKQLASAGAPARWAMAACGAAALLVASVFVIRAQNPHFVVLAADLDTPSFNKAVQALANADIRFETSMGAAPHMIRVEESRRFDAMNAIHLSGEYLGGSRGISSGLDGSSSVFLGQSERHQRTQKRIWEEAEMQLEALDYVAKAKVTVSGQSTSPLVSMRPDARSASVVVNLTGLTRPSQEETRALVSIIRGAIGVPEDRIAIVDQHSNVLFDGADSGGADSLLALEERFARDRTAKAQQLLDRMFGPGMTVVGVSGEWRQVKEESVSETLDPTKKPRSERKRTTKEPEWPNSPGGPAGVAANTQGDAPAGPTPDQLMAMSETTDTEKAYAFASKTTHTVSQPQQLARISISLVVDSSLEEELPAAVNLVKSLVNFNEERGDQIEFTAAELPGLERNEEGVPVLPEPVEAPEAPSPMLEVLLKYGLELLAGLAFLMVLFKTLKAAKAADGGGTGDSGSPGAPGSKGRTTAGGVRVSGERAADGSGLMEEEIDLDALARGHIEELLKEEPEKVSALLSRWALAEDSYAEAGASR